MFYSPIEPLYYILPVIGLIVGLLGTLVGGGGGFVFLPVLVLALGVPTHTAVITSLVATLPVGVIGSIGHYRKGNVNVRLAAMFAVAGLFGAFAGVALANQFSDDGLQKVFGIYSILMGIYIFFNTQSMDLLTTNLEGAIPLINRKAVLKSSFFGFSAGTITGAFGTSGAAPLLAGLFSMKASLKIVVGTSLLIVASNTIFAIGSHFLVGRMDLTLVIFLTVGSAIGASIGPLLLSKIDTVKSEGNVRYLFAVIMALLGVVMIWG